MYHLINEELSKYSYKTFSGEFFSDEIELDL
jgi:hypothetical protein